MPTKKFTGRKVGAEELLIHISGECDEGRILFNDKDSAIAPILKQFVENDIQLLIMGFIGEESVPVFCEEEAGDDYNEYEDEYEDDFIIDEQEREDDKYQHYQEEVMYERREYYEW
ncbi:hypothetical protein CL646_05375 [bacterium]|nr:hypothetical protein [bacterium]|tara:strand:+ start:42 stop:389 length:348 start_codon:yes stop_codon:yes gene_type:complete